LVLSALVGVDDLDVGQPGVVIDGDVDVVVAHLRGAARGPVLGGVTSVGPPPAAGADVAEFLDVEVDQLAGAGAFVAAPPVRAVFCGGRIGAA
jgi:hypothetical protein